jgi:hypothetical protein
MANHVVWKKIQRQDMPVGRQYIKSKCVLKIKRNGMFRARLVACGYSQIPAINFTDNYSPVINNITLHLLLLVWLHFKLTATIVDLETAFLYGRLEEQTFMECPKGMLKKNDKVLLLLKCI